MDDQLSGGDEDALDRELEELQKRRHAKTPDSKAARELDAEATSTVEAYVAQLEYAARLAIGVWDGDSDAKFGPSWKIVGYIAEKAGNAERAARGIVRTIYDANGWSMGSEPVKVLEQTGFSQDEQPAVRRARRAGQYLPYPCYFCGENQVKLSYADRPDDAQRIEFYCDNVNCEAREVVVLMRRGLGAHERADVRALQALDSGDRQVAESPES